MSENSDKNPKSLDRRKSVRSADVAKKVLEEIEAREKKLRKEKSEGDRK